VGDAADVDASHATLIGTDASLSACKRTLRHAPTHTILVNKPVHFTQPSTLDVHALHANMTQSVDDSELGRTMILLPLMDKKPASFSTVDDWKQHLIKAKAGISMHYAHARMTSILRNSTSVPTDVDESTFDPMVEHEATTLALHLLQFDRYLSQSIQHGELSKLVWYMTRLTKAVGSAAGVLRVKNTSVVLAAPRHLLWTRALHVLHTSLWTLGIQGSDSM
jgi:hypothetical protein